MRTVWMLVFVSLCALVGSARANELPTEVPVPSARMAPAVDVVEAFEQAHVGVSKGLRLSAIGAGVALLGTVSTGMGVIAGLSDAPAAVVSATWRWMRAPAFGLRAPGRLSAQSRRWRLWVQPSGC